MEKGKKGGGKEGGGKGEGRGGGRGLLLKSVRVFETEIYTPERRAEFMLNNAVDATEYDAAVAEIEATGLDPDSIPHQSRPVV